MAVDQALLALAEEIESGEPWPRPRCLACGTGHIRFRQPKSFLSAEARALLDHPGFDPSWVRGTFLARGRCENPGCQQVAHAAGQFRVDHAQKSWSFDPSDPDDQSYPPYSEFYRVAQLYPAPVLMQVPADAPKEVGDGALRAARVLFADPGLAATALRGTVERFLTVEEGAPPNGQSRGFRNLDGRIQAWRKARPGRDHIADLLSAVKWLGNTGTHEDLSLSIREVLDGASLLDEAFHRIYTSPGIDARAKQITETHQQPKPPATD